MDATGSDQSDGDGSGDEGDSCRRGDDGVCESGTDESTGGESSNDKKNRRRNRRARSAPSDSTPQVYTFVQPKQEGASAKLVPRITPKGTQRKADPRWWRAKMVEELLDDLGTQQERVQTTQQSTHGLSRKGVSTGLSAEMLSAEMGFAVELAEALQDIMIVAADGGRRWPVDRGGRVVLTSWPAGEKWWRGYPEGVLVSGPEEAGDVPREVVIRVSEKAQSEAEAANMAAELAAERDAEHSTDIATAQAPCSAAEPAGSPDTGTKETKAVDRASAEAFSARATSYTYDEQLALGLQHIHAHRYRDAIINFKRCRALEPTDPAACYNIACCYSLLRLSGLALRWLTSAVDLGLMDGGVLLEDTDLDNIRDAPRFRQLQQRLHRETTIVRPAASVGDRNEERRAGVGDVKFSPADDESEEEVDAAAELVDAHLLGLPLPSTPRAAFDGGDGGPIVTAALESAGDRSDSTAGGSTEESAASTEVSAQAENDDEAEVAKMHRERLQRQQVKTNRRTKTKKSKLKPEPEPELEPENRESEYHGVSWNTSSRLWQSALPFEGQSKFIGQFDEETDAAHAHDDAAHETYGADVHCNANGVLLNFSMACADCRTWAQACMAAGEPQEAVDWLEQALQDTSQPSDEERPLVAYKLAGCYATCLDSSLALRWLSSAIQWGLGTIRAADELEPHTEAVFASLWRDARFLTLCAKLDEARHGPARREHTRLVRRHRAARASACVKTAMASTATDSGNGVDHAEEHASSPTVSYIDAMQDPGARGEQVDVSPQEHELDLFFEFWCENSTAMNDLFGRLATRLIPLDLIRTTLRRIIGGLNLKTADVEDRVLIMLGLASCGISEQGACGMPGAPSMFHTDIERVSGVAFSAATVGINSGGANMSASSRHRSLKTEALCHAASPNQLPRGAAATVPVLARVVDREDFLSRCADVAAAWSKAASRNSRSEWLQEFEARGRVASSPSADATTDDEETVIADAPQAVQIVNLDATRDRGPLAPEATDTSMSPGGLTVADVNMPRSQVTPEKPAAVVHAQLVLTPQDLRASGGSLTSQRRWQDASDGLPDNTRRDWTVATVSTWLRALGMSDSVVGRAHEAKIDGARLLDAAEDPDPAACTRVLDALGLATLGSRKLLSKAITSLACKADRMLGDSTALPPRAPDADTFASSFGSTGGAPSLAEAAFFERLNWSVAGGEEDQQPAKKDNLVLDRFSLHRAPSSQLASSSFGDVSSITMGL